MIEHEHLQPVAIPPPESEPEPPKPPRKRKTKPGLRRLAASKAPKHTGRRLAVLLLFAFTLIAVSPGRASTPAVYKAGEYPSESVMAEVSFEVVDLAETENARRRAGNMSPYVYNVDSQLVSEQLSRIAAVFAQVEQIASKDVLSWEERQRLATISIRPTLSDTTLGLLLQPENFAPLRDQALRLASQVLEQGVFGEQPILSPQVEVVRLDGSRVTFSRDAAPTVTRVHTALEEACRREAGGNAVLAGALYELAKIGLGPTVGFDDAATEARQLSAREQTPEVMRTIHRNEMVVQAGHRVTNQDVAELLAYRRALGQGRQGKAYVGYAGMLALLMLSGLLYLRAVRPKILERARLIWLVVVAAMLIVGVARVLLLADVPDAFRILVPVAPCAIMLALMLDVRVALGVAVLASLAVALMQEYGVAFLVPTIVSTVLGVCTLGRVTKRADFAKPGVVIGFSAAGLILAMGLARDAGLERLLTSSAIGLGNGLIVALLVPGLLTPLEKLSGITTNITLLEYCDLKHPLLVRMQREAPGTFHHSLTMASLAEAAAEAIGANPLLARVGCYFHDIGKMVKAEYFSENQHGFNKHDLITPSMSAVILTAHVKEGIELGRQEGLPEEILAFIPEHQGTAIMPFFYKKAVERAPEGQTVNENDFRYPGPRPQSRETAICMLADGVEAASRSLVDPTPARIDSMVNKITNNKFLDGQLDECDLTLRDLHRIGQAFTRVLSAMLHTRVAYPAEQTAEEIKRAGEQKQQQQQQKKKGAGPRPESQSPQGLPLSASAKQP